MRVITITQDESANKAPKGYTVCSSSVSGGSFEAYIQEIQHLYNGNVCLRLLPESRYFPLPCYDGQGEAISEDELQRHKHRGKFSGILCCNWVFLSETPAVILYDDWHSLQRKYEIAETCGIPLLQTTNEIYKKIKTP